MQRFGISLEEAAIIETVKEWSGTNKRNSVKFDEFNKVFKGFGNEGGTTRTIKSNRSQVSEHTLGCMLKELQSNVPSNNLVSFFRTFDSK